MSLVSSMNIAQQALAVNQAALSVVSNNIANVDTPGYSRLRADLASVVNYTPTYGSTVTEANLLSGVQIANIKRYSNSFLQSYSRQTNSSYEYLNQYSTISTQLEDLTNSLNNTGLSQAFTDFYAAADALGNAPADGTARVSYIQAAKNVVIQFNTIANSLSSMKESLVGDPTSGNASSLQSSQIYNSAQETNNLLDQIASVNSDIVKTNAANGSSAPLLDKRDALLKSLSSLMPANVQEESNGTVTVSIGNHDLVSGIDAVAHLKVDVGDTTTPAIISLESTDTPPVPIVNNINSQINSGSMGAILDLCGPSTGNLTIAEISQNLDTMASGFAGIMNDIQNGTPAGQAGTHAMCLDSNGLLTDSTATNFLFVNSDSALPSATGITAANLSVNSALIGNTNLIAASRLSAAEYAKGAAVYGKETGNNANMTLVVQSRSTSYSTTGNTTVEKFLANFVGDVGAQAENINTQLTNQTLVNSQVQTNLSSETGVNLDDELTDLIKYQRAYQAASRVFSVCSSLMEELINLGK